MNLDTDVSTILGKELWESIDPYGLTKSEGNEVTIRHLLSHTAGMTVGGFSGYPKLEALDQEIKELEEQLQKMKVKQPPLAQQKQSASEQTLAALDLAGAVALEGRMRDCLDYLDLETGRDLRQMKDIQQLQGRLNFLKKLRKTGKITTDDVITGKGNSDAVKIAKPPGSEFLYSGGGTTVLQKVIEVIAGRPYDKVTQELVLDKLNMRNSTFYPDERHTTSHGNNEHGKALPGGSRYHPELAAAGLWTTPSDLAQVAIGIQRSLAGKRDALISA